MFKLDQKQDWNIHNSFLDRDAASIDGGREWPSEHPLPWHIFVFSHKNRSFYVFYKGYWCFSIVFTKINGWKRPISLIFKEELIYFFHNLRRGFKNKGKIIGSNRTLLSRAYFCILISSWNKVTSRLDLYTRIIKM